MSDGDGLVVFAFAADDKGAGILHATGASSGVAHVTDTTAGSGQAGTSVREDLAYLAHADAMHDMSIAVIDSHPRALLAAMLQSGERQGEILAHIDILLILLCIYTHDSASIA